MDQTNNPNFPEDEKAAEPGAGGPPPRLNDPEPPQYGDPVTPQPATPPAPPPPGLAPEPASAPPPPHYGDEGTGAAATTTGSLTNPTKDERNWAMFAHLSAIAAGLIFSFTTIPAFGFVGPLVIWLMKRDESPFVADQAKEALNFNISIGIVLFAMWVLAMLLIWTIVVPFIMFPLMAIVGLIALVLVIVAAIKASNGEVYRYPFTLRLIN